MLNQLVRHVLNYNQFSVKTDLGVGNVHTWHGSTEVRKGCPAIVTLESLGDGYEENSDGETDDVDSQEQ